MKKKKKKGSRTVRLYKMFNMTLLLKDLMGRCLSNDPGKVDSNFFCYVATVLSPHRNVLIFTQRMDKPT